MILLLYSCIFTRGIDKVHRDMDNSFGEQSTMMAHHGYASQASPKPMPTLSSLRYLKYILRSMALHQRFSIGLRSIYKYMYTYVDPGTRAAEGADKHIYKYVGPGTRAAEGSDSDQVLSCR